MPDNQTFDDRLVDDFKKGKNHALQELYRLHYYPLCYFSYKLIQDKAESQDIVSETFTKLWRLRENFNSGSNIRAFLYITVRNNCLDFLRRVQRNQSAHKDLYHLMAGEKEETVQNRIVKAELLEEIYREIESLPVKRKEVVKLFYLEGLTMEEISLKLGMSTTTVRTSKFKALQQLRNTMLRKKLLTATLHFVILRMLDR